jgi:hypothetical protein
MDFFAELLKLQLEGPRLGMLQLKCENSEYTFATDQCKNCYLIMNAVRNEDCMHGRDVYNNDDCVDSDHIFGCELCYQGVNLKNCYNCDFLQDSESCRDCRHGYDLKGCSDCIGCAGLRQKKFHIFNKPYSEDEYHEKVRNLSLEQIKQGFEQVKLTAPHMFGQIINSENCVGDYIHNSQNVFAGFDVVECQDVGYVSEVADLKDCYDIFVLEHSELCYEISSCYKLYNCNFCYMCVESQDLEYSEFCSYCKHCFGCTSLVRKKYHILNKPYSKEEYFTRVAEIKTELKAKGEYGKRFLPSSYPYEDSVATWERF